MKWKKERLRDIIKFRGGGTPRKDVPEFWGNEIPWATVKDFKSLSLSCTIDSITKQGLDSSSTNLISAGHVIIPTRMALGKAAINTIDLAINQDLRALIPLVPIDANYLLHSMLGLADVIERNGSGATVKGITQDKLADLQIPLPPLPEQRRIAAILDAADELRRQRRAALAELDTLLQSTFIDLFGDPVTNPKGWDVIKLSQVVQRLDGGKNIAQSESETSYKILKVSAVTSGNFLPEESKYLPEDYRFPDSFLVKQGDLLISRANTKELIGATAYVWNTPGNLVLPDKIWKFIWKDNANIHPLFFLYVSRKPEFRRQIGALSSGTSGSMKNIPKPKLLSLSIPLPPLPLQHHFATIVAGVERQKERMRAHLGELDALFASLQQRAFNGDS
jgi:type I restriction enzyme S subunit